MQNGFVVACEETREAVIIDPGDGVRELLAFADRQKLAIRHILLTHAHVDHVSGVGIAKRALNVPIYAAPRRSVSVRTRRRNRPNVRHRASSRRRRSTVSTCQARRYRSATFGRARTTRLDIAPAVSASRSDRARRARARSCLSATHCSPARSAAPICRAATTPRSFVDSQRAVRVRRRRACVFGPRAGDDDRRESGGRIRFSRRSKSSPAS